jgi:adenylyltransferase/sulfurtransferase
VLGVLPGMIGTMQACEAIKLITGIGESLSGRLWLLNALTMTSQTLRLVTDPKSREIKELPPEGYGAVCSTGPVVEETDVYQLQTALEGKKKPQLVDVREGWERDQGAILPSLHVPLGDLESGDAASALRGLDPSVETVVFCASGRRSQRGTALLLERYGFKSVVSLRGGFKAWTVAIPQNQTA